MRIRDKRRKYRSRWGIVFLCNKLGNILSLGQSEKGSESQLHSGFGWFCLQCLRLNPWPGAC